MDEDRPSTSRSSTFGKQGKILHCQAREVVANVIDFMRKEADTFRQYNHPTIPLTNFRERVMTATGISKSLYESISKEAKARASGALTSFSTPERKTDNESETGADDSPNPKKKYLKKNAVPSQKLPATPNYGKSRNLKTKKLALGPTIITERLESNTQEDDPLLRVCVKVEAEVENLEVKDVQINCNFHLFDVLSSNEKLKTLTGIDNNILQTLEKCVNRVAVYNSIKVINLEQRLTMLFVKLKLNLPFVSLGNLFGISSTSCAKFFYSTLELVAATLKPVVYWPSRNEDFEMTANTPLCFNFKDLTRVPLEYTEVQVQKCNCLTCRARTNSYYEGTETVKFLIGITPSSLISHVSQGCRENASDNKLVVGKEGFLIDEECGKLLLQLIRPPHLKKSSQISKGDATKNKVHSIHIEKVIQRIKRFRILNDKVEYSVVPCIDQIIFVIAALVNLAAPVLEEDE